MLDFFIAADEHQIREANLPRRLSLGGPIYWFLHRYFVQASLDPGDFNFLNPYEDTEIKGYQLHRLATEMKEVLADVASRPSTFSVFVGWSGQDKSEDAEEWKQVEKSEVEQAAQRLRSLAIEAHQKEMILFAVGD